MNARPFVEMIHAAYCVVSALLRTEVTNFDVVTALDEECDGWAEQDRDMVLHLAHVIAQTTCYVLVVALDAPRNATMAEMVHHGFVAHALGEYLDVPDPYYMPTDEDREKCILDRYVLYPLRPD